MGTPRKNRGVKAVNISISDTFDSFLLSFQVAHPTWRADEIICGLSLKPAHIQSVGDEKITKSGNRLGGIYKYTNIRFPIVDSAVKYKEIDMVEILSDAVNKFRFLFIDEIIASGGECSILIGVFCHTNIWCCFNHDLLSKLAAHKINLKLDIYGGVSFDDNY
jgi:hypothetical protein